MGSGKMRQQHSSHRRHFELIIQNIVSRLKRGILWFLPTKINDNKKTGLPITSAVKELVSLIRKYSLKSCQIVIVSRVTEKIYLEQKKIKDGKEKMYRV